MDTKDLLKATKNRKKLIQNNNYYKNVFKKTERIVSVVFYIAYTNNQKDKYQRVLSDIEDQARRVHTVVADSLTVDSHLVADVVPSLIHALTILESKLTIAQTAGVLTPEVTNLLLAEINAVEQSLITYCTEEPLTNSSAPRARLSKSAPVVTNKGIAFPTLKPNVTAQNRRAHLRAVIAAKGQASIKDITDTLSDISQKTIQRELNIMIKDKKIKRVGKKRWSRYVLM